MLKINLQLPQGRIVLTDSSGFSHSMTEPEATQLINEIRAAMLEMRPQEFYKPRKSKECHKGCKCLICEIYKEVS
jgi:hypothetical protein